MSEFGMPQYGAPTYGAAPGPASAAPAAPMEWYSVGAGNYNNAAQYAYAPPPSAAPAYGSTGFEDEPPLLEELGIDVGAILRKTRAILLHQMGSRHLEEVDMGGALVFLLLFSGLHLLMGKVHFGVVLGWSVVQSMVLYWVVNQIAGEAGSETKALDLYSCCCITGYGMVPLILHAAAALALRRPLVTGALAVLCALWSAVTATKVLARMSPALQDVRALVAYPCFLMYGTFALLTAY